MPALAADLHHLLIARALVRATVRHESNHTRPGIAQIRNQSREKFLRPLGALLPRRLVRKRSLSLDSSARPSRLTFAAGFSSVPQFRLVLRRFARDRRT